MFVTQYKEIKKAGKFKIRNFIRDVVLSSLSAKIQLFDYKYEYQKPKVQFLYFHHVFNDEVIKFNNLLKWLTKYYSFISYSEAVDRILTNRIDRSYIAFSFDDGFKNNMNAAKILEKYNATACFFLNPDTIGLNDIKRNKEYCAKTLHLPPVEFIDWNDVSELLKKGHEIGSHTIGHINMANTDIHEVEDNLCQSYEILTQKCGYVKHFAFPYGRFSDFNKRAYDLVFNIGYNSCASAERGCHINDNELKKNELMIRRDHIVVNWPKSHIKYFLLYSSFKSSIKNNYIPYD